MQSSNPGSERASPMATLIGLLAGQRARLGLAASLAAGSALLELLLYYLLYRAAELALLNVPPGRDLLHLAGLLLLTLLGKYGLLTLGAYFSHVAAFQILYEVRLRLAQSLTRLPLQMLGRYSSGGLRKIILNDVERLETFIAHHSIELIAAVVTPLAAGGFLFWLDWRMALAALSTIIPAWLAQACMSRGMDERVRSYNIATEQLNGATVEYLRGIPVMKAFRQSASSFKLLRERLEAYHRLVEGFSRKAVPGWSAFVVLLTANIFVLLPLGLWLNAQGQLPLPNLILALVLGSGLLKPLLRLMFFSSAIREICGGVERIQPLLAPVAVQVSGRLPAHAGVRLQNLSFSYQARPILQELNLELRPGSFNALVGPSGAGKSTLAYLLSGLLPPDSGEVLLGEVSLASLGDRDRAQAIAVVSQDAFLFQGSLAQNLRLAKPLASDRQLHDVLAIVQARDLVRSLPQGLDTQVGERGARLSGGERQRIAIARALLAGAPVLVLDEATAFADSLTEAAFYTALRKRYPQTTVLVIAHRLYAVRHAEQILLLEEGRLVASGSHAQLLHGNGTYQRLWHSQFQAHAWHIRQQEVRDVDA